MKYYFRTLGRVVRRMLKDNGVPLLLGILLFFIIMALLTWIALRYPLYVPYFVAYLAITGLFSISDATRIDFLAGYVESYSTGMKKKLALMGVLLQKNECFILDEPFNGLDLESSILLSEVILRLKSLGKTILISSHIFSTLRDVCDTILVLNNGNFETITDKADFAVLKERLKEEIISKDIDKLIF